MPEPINTDYFAQLTQQVQLATSCAELQALADQALAPLNAQLAQITAAEAQFAALQALLTPPAANPTAIVSWINELIGGYLTPQLAAYAKLTAQVAALTAQIGQLSSAITSAAARFESCSIAL